MARRGRFGRAEAGSSNLSSLIQQLIREQKAAEERLLLEAFYNGTVLYGKVPSIQDVIAFYKDLADLGGFEENSLEYQALLQKIEAANNFDIKRDYNKLMADFEQSGGANYDQVMGFLNGRAQDSTDQNDLEAYQSAVSATQKAYVGYRGNDLVAGLITAEDYRSLTQGVIAGMDPNDPLRGQLISTAFNYEWSAEKSKWDNRLVAGTVTLNQYVNWVKGFRQDLLANGISKDSDIFTQTLAAVARAKKSYGGGGGSPADPAKLRLQETKDEMSSVYTLAASLVGAGEEEDRTVQEILEGKDVTKSLINNPGLMLQFAEFLDANPFYSNPALEQLGIKDSEGLYNWLQNSIESGYYDAQVIEINGGASESDDWFNLAVTNGAASGLAQFDYASTKWLKDQANAKDNDVLLGYYNDQWKNYLNGETSIYGVLPTNIPAEYQGYLINEINGANGRSTDGPTLTGTVNRGSEINWDNIAITDSNRENLINGKGVNEWNEKTGSFVYVDGKPGNGVEKGQYQYVAFEKVGGEVVAYTVSLIGAKIVDKDGKQVVGHRYTRPDGTIIAIDLKGNEISADSLQSVGGDFKVGDNGVEQTGEKAKTYDLSGLQKSSAIPFNAADPEERRAMILAGMDPVTGLFDPNDLRAAADAYAVAAGALDDNARKSAEAEYGEIFARGNIIEAEQIAASPEGDTVEGQLKIASLRGETDRANALNFIANNQDKLVQVGPNDWRFKPGAAPQQESRGPLAAAGGYLGGILGAGIGSMFAGVGAAPGFAVGSALGAGILGLQEPADLQMIRISEQAKTEEEKEEQRKRGFAAPNAQQYQQTGYAGGSNNLFFRNIPSAAPKNVPFATPSAGGISPYLSLQATPTPKPPAIPKPLPVALTPFNPQDPEARRALVLAEINRPKPVPTTPAPTRGRQ
jgi:hypothetical protein